MTEAMTALVDGQRHVDLGALDHGRPVLVAERVPELDAGPRDRLGRSGRPGRRGRRSSPACRSMRATMAVSARLVPAQDVAVAQLDRSRSSEIASSSTAVGRLAQPAASAPPTGRATGVSTRRAARGAPPTPGRSTLPDRCCSTPDRMAPTGVAIGSAEEVELIEAIVFSGVDGRVHAVDLDGEGLRIDLDLRQSRCCAPCRAW